MDGHQVDSGDWVAHSVNVGHICRDFAYFQEKTPTHVQCLHYDLAHLFADHIHIDLSSALAVVPRPDEGRQSREIQECCTVLWDHLRGTHLPIRPV